MAVDGYEKIFKLQIYNYQIIIIIIPHNPSVWGMLTCRICSKYNLVAVSKVENPRFKQGANSTDTCQEKGDAENDPELNLSDLPSINISMRRLNARISA